MKGPTVTELFQRIHDRALELGDETTTVLTDMVRVPSFSGKEQAVCEVVRSHMERAGFDEVRFDGLGNVIGRIGDGPRVIAFDAHLDTVYPGDPGPWDFDPFSPKVEDGQVWGRGTVDQEGGMAAMVTAGRIIKELGLAEGLTLYFTGTVMEEDCDGLCWTYLVNEEKLRPELVVITEPTNLGIYRGHRGRMEMQVRVQGLSCHGSAPERGDNAIYKISRIALEIEKLHERLAEDPFLGRGSVTVSQVFFTGPSQCAVPDSATISLDRRLTWGEDKDLAVAEVRDAAARAGYPDAEVTIPVYAEPAYTGTVYPMEKYYPTWVVAEDSPWVTDAVAAFEGVYGERPVIDKWVFSTNAVAIAGLAGIPCIGFGPGDEVLAHAPNEHTPLDQLVRAPAFYAAFVARLGGKA